MARKDRHPARKDARLNVRRQMLWLRAIGKTMAEISAITDYPRTYLSLLVRTLRAQPL